MDLSGQAVIYCRISQDTEGKERGIERQEADCKALAAARGLEVVEIFRENDVSAAGTSKKPRPKYDAMLRKVRDGEATHILAYSNSRLTRRPLELEGLLELHQQTGVTVLTVVSGEDDLSTADGRMVARIKGNMDAAEVERQSERWSRMHRGKADLGEPVGRRMFGWQEDKVSLDPEESARAREAVQQYLNDVPLREVARRLTLDGFRTTVGGEWTAQTLRNYFRNPRLVGIRTYRGEVHLDSDGEPMRGTWEPLIDQDTFERLAVKIGRPPAYLSKISDPDKRRRAAQKANASKPRRGKRKYLLSGLLRCGVCGGPMFGSKAERERWNYACGNGSKVENTHSLTVSGKPTEKYVETTFLLWYATNVARPQDGEHEANVFPGEERLEETKAKIRELMAAYNNNELSAGLVFPRVSKLETERDELQAEKEAWLAEDRPTPPTKHISPKEWEGWPVERKQAELAKYLEVVMVKPTKKQRTPTFDRDRIDVVPKPTKGWVHQAKAGAPRW